MATTVSVGAKVSPSGDRSVGAIGVPIGAVIDFAVPEANIPSGWLICDGRAISRTTYSDLFNVIGTNWGTGDGSLTFNIPDLRGFAAAGLDNMGGSNAGRLSTMGSTARTLGGNFGEQTHVLTENEIPNHQHSIANGFVSAAGIASGVNYNQQNSPNVYCFGTGSNAGHNNIQPTRVLNKIIRALLG